MTFLGGVVNIFTNGMISLEELSRIYGYAKKHKYSSFLFVKNNLVLPFKAVVTPDLKTLTPNQLARDFEVTKGYVCPFTITIPAGETVYFGVDDCPHTIELEKWNIELSDIKKGSVLSSIAYNLVRTVILTYMTSKNKRDMILIIGIFSLLFFSVGMMIGMRWD